MINVEEVRAQVADILSRFPSGQGVVYRPVYDKYGQPETDLQRLGQIGEAPAGDSQATGSGRLGEVTFWWKQPETPKAVETDRSGTRYGEDDPKWVCLLWSEDLPDARRGDLFVTEGKIYRIGNRENRMNVRVFWQLFEVTV